MEQSNPSPRKQLLELPLLLDWGLLQQDEEILFALARLEAEPLDEDGPERQDFRGIGGLAVSYSRSFSATRRWRR